MLELKLVVVFLGIAAAGLITCIGHAASVSSSGAWVIGISGAALLIAATAILYSHRARDGDALLAILAAIAGVVLRYPAEALLPHNVSAALQSSRIEAAVVLAPIAILSLWISLRRPMD